MSLGGDLKKSQRILPCQPFYAGISIHQNTSKEEQSSNSRVIPIASNLFDREYILETNNLALRTKRRTKEAKRAETKQATIYNPWTKYSRKGNSSDTAIAIKEQQISNHGIRRRDEQRNCLCKEGRYEGKEKRRR